MPSLLSSRDDERPQRLVGPVYAVVMIPALEQPTRLSRAERRALRVQRQAILRGKCACGACAAPPESAKAGEVKPWPIAHNASCPAAGLVLERLAERLGPALKLEVIPGRARGSPVNGATGRARLVLIVEPEELAGFRFEAASFADELRLGADLLARDRTRLVRELAMPAHEKREPPAGGSERLAQEDRRCRGYTIK